MIEKLCSQLQKNSGAFHRSQSESNSHDKHPAPENVREPVPESPCCLVAGHRKISPTILEGAVCARAGPATGCVVVKVGLLPTAHREGDRQPPAGGVVAEEQVCDGGAGELAQEPRDQDRRGRPDRTLQRERAAIFQGDHRGTADGGHRLCQLLLDRRHDDLRARLRLPGERAWLPDRQHHHVRPAPARPFPSSIFLNFVTRTGVT
jgi:hypothetical protein